VVSYHRRVEGKKTIRLRKMLSAGLLRRTEALRKAGQSVRRTSSNGFSVKPRGKPRHGKNKRRSYYYTIEAAEEAERAATTPPLDRQILKASQLMQNFDCSGAVPVPSFTYKLILAHPSFLEMNFDERMRKVLEHWRLSSAAQRASFVRRPLDGLLVGLLQKNSKVLVDASKPLCDEAHKIVGLIVPPDFYTSRRVFSTFVKLNVRSLRGPLMARTRSLALLFRRMTASPEMAALVLEKLLSFKTLPCGEVLASLESNIRERRREEAKRRLKEIQKQQLLKQRMQRKTLGKRQVNRSKR
jgi:hypothetical protein